MLGWMRETAGGRVTRTGSATVAGRVPCASCASCASRASATADIARVPLASRD